MERHLLMYNGREEGVFPSADEILLANAEGSADPDIYLREYRGVQIFYIYRAEVTAYGTTLPELLEPISRADIQRELNWRPHPDQCGARYDLERLQALGFSVPPTFDPDEEESATP